jgi:signal transduction histidine kinase
MVIILFILITALVFNLVVGLYMKKDVENQLNNVAENISDTAIEKGNDIFQKSNPIGESKNKGPENEEHIKDYYLILNKTLKESLVALNANYVLFTVNGQLLIDPFSELPDENIVKTLQEKISTKPEKKETYTFNINSVKYLSIIIPVFNKSTFELGWIIVYSTLEKSEELQFYINYILFVILLISAIVTSFISSITAKKISQPFTSLSNHIGEIAKRNFNKKIRLPVDDELKVFVDNINIMSEKLESYDKAQKTFLQNASHEFRTPLMSIQSYAEGIKYDVVDSKNASDIIISETKRLTHLVENLLFLSRLDSIEENYNFLDLDFSNFIYDCIERVSGISSKYRIKIKIDNIPDNLIVRIDEEKLSRAILNVLSNCIRYAKNILYINGNLINKNTIELIISDDGPGFQEININNIFDRFQKGKKGKFGLGLAISKNVIEKHNGTIKAQNSKYGAMFKIKLPIIIKITSKKHIY